MCVARSVAVDWSRISTKLGLHRGEPAERSRRQLLNLARYVFVLILNPLHSLLCVSLLLETLAALSAFRKRATDARVAHQTYSNAPKSVDFEHYRSVLKNKDIVAEGEKLFKSFKPVDYDLSAQLKAIEAFEQKAVSMTNETPNSRRTDTLVRLTTVGQVSSGDCLQD